MRKKKSALTRRNWKTVCSSMLAMGKAAGQMVATVGGRARRGTESHEVRSARTLKRDDEGLAGRTDQDEKGSLSQNRFAFGAQHCRAQKW